MSISVIMATYKEPEFMLRQAIESILKQTYKEFEYIIILDNPDNEVHKRIVEEYMERDNRIKFFVNEQNIGLTESLNKGLAHANGEYICRMDADDISVPERFQLQKQYLEKKKADLIGGAMQVIDEDGNLMYSINRVPKDINKVRKALRYNQVVAHPTWFGKKDVFDSLSGYRKIPLCEDYDFTLRAIISGYKISNVNRVVLQYRMTSQSVSRSNLFEQYLYARYITTMYKKGQIADVELAKKYVAKKNNKIVANRYLRANALFNRVLNDMEQKNFLCIVKDGLSFAFTSAYYWDKVLRFLIVTLYS